MGKIYKKQHTNQNVYDAALERMNHVFDRFDNVQISFSGGKDSTAVLNVALTVARERGRLPLEVIFFDEEAIHPTTIEYVERVASIPDIDFKWLCLPVMHRNACSRKQPWWYCWNPDEKEKWIYPLPKLAITDIPGFKIGMTVPDAAELLYPNKKGTSVQLLGLRASESLRRYRVVSMKKEDNWISGNQGKNRYRAFPIYDWTAEDVWTAPALLGWDYNKTYDIFDKLGVGWDDQRVCPPYGEEPLRGLWWYAECFPEMWHKMIGRVHGCATAVRYANTELYSVALKTPPKGMNWQEYTAQVIQLYPEKDQAVITESLNSLIAKHNEKSKNVIQDADPDPITGISWMFLCKIALRGDFKNRIAGVMEVQGEKARKKSGISYHEAIQQNGVDAHKDEFFNPDEINDEGRF